MNGNVTSVHIAYEQTNSDFDFFLFGSDCIYHNCCLYLISIPFSEEKNKTND